MSSAGAAGRTIPCTGASTAIAINSGMTRCARVMRETLAQRRQRGLERRQRARVEEHEAYLIDRAGVASQLLDRRAECDRRGLVEGIAIHPGRDRGEGDGAEPVRAREREAVLVARGEQSRHLRVAAVD